MKQPTAEQARLAEHYQNQKNWLQWGPYLSERQWGTVREDYSPGGTAWDYFPHDHARSRAYRWGEDGIAGISDEKSRLCFAVTMWNGRDPILKERLFGLGGPEGNHAEDVKELYYYLDNTPSHAYMKHLYKYPQGEFPYADLVATNRRRSKDEPEYELLDTGLFDSGRYFDVFTEYAKADADDLCIRITAHNRGADEADLVLLPTLWFRNQWSFGHATQKPKIEWENGCARAHHPELGEYFLYFEKPERSLFTENETNSEKLYGAPNPTPFVKDALHRAVVGGDYGFLEGKTEGTKFAPLYSLKIKPFGKVEIRLRLSAKRLTGNFLKKDFDAVFEKRRTEADEFYESLRAAGRGQGDGDAPRAQVQRQALAGMLWSKQFFSIDIPQWLDGDPGQPPPPSSRKGGRNHQWQHLNNEDIISMPDKWEYPWYAAWDLAFHCVPLAMADPDFAKNQLLLFLREWYMHPNGQIPAYEWAFGDVNPPVHAWSCLQVYKMDKAKTGQGDLHFLKRAFSKLLLNFTWWVNRKDWQGKNVFEGGFLGMDNIGVFDRSATIPGGGHLEQADGTAWMAMYCLNMLEMAIEIAKTDPAYEDLCTKFFEHFVYIAESLNRIGKDWTGAWDEEEGFFYDILSMPNGRYVPLEVRSMVGLSTLFAALTLDPATLTHLPEFHFRLEWFAQYRQKIVDYQVVEELNPNGPILLSLIPKARMERLLRAMLDESEFLSPAGIRSVSKVHETPYRVEIEGQEFGLRYEPGESSTGLFGGNSNWRGPVWFPMNYLLVQSLREYDRYWGDDFRVEFPTGSGEFVNLSEAAERLAQRMASVFLKNENGDRPCHDGHWLYREDPHFSELVLFYEYFHGETGRGVGASHQTGWTGVAAELI